MVYQSICRRTLRVALFVLLVVSISSSTYYIVASCGWVLLTITNYAVTCTVITAVAYLYLSRIKFSIQINSIFRQCNLSIMFLGLTNTVYFPIIAIFIPIYDKSTNFTLGNCLPAGHVEEKRRLVLPVVHLFWVPILVFNVLIFVLHVNCTTSAIAEMGQKFKQILLKPVTKASLKAINLESGINEILALREKLHHDISLVSFLLFVMLTYLFFNNIGKFITHYRETILFTNIGTFVRILNYFVDLFSMAQASDQCERQKMEITETLTCLALKAIAIDDQKSVQVIQELRFKLLQRDFRLNACDLFYLTRNLVVTIVGLSLTYAVLIYKSSHQ